MDKHTDGLKIKLEETNINEINQEKLFSLLKSLELQICKLENRILQLENRIEYTNPTFPFGPMNPYGSNPPGTFY